MSFSRFYVCSSLSAQCYNSTAGGDRLRDAVFCFPGSQGILQGNNAKAGSKPLAGKELTMNFGSNLRKLRKEKNLTQEALAECLNVSAQTVSKWENGASMPDISLLPLLADYFQVSVDSLLMHDTVQRLQDVRNLGKEIRALAEAGKKAEAYTRLKASMNQWKLSVSVNHLMSWTARQYALECTGADRTRLLEEAISWADRTIFLDCGETGRTVQAKMSKCYCLMELDRRQEARDIAESLPSLYSSREIVLSRITSGDEQQQFIQSALQDLDELKDSLQALK